MNSSQHMVCFLLYACLAASEYQTSHSSQLLALMKDCLLWGIKMVSLIHSCFSRSDEQILLLHPLSCLVLSPPHYPCPTSGPIASWQDHSLTSSGLPASVSACSSPRFHCQRGLRQAQISHIAPSLKPFSGFCYLQPGIQTSQCARWVKQGRGSLWPLNRTKLAVPHSGTVEPPLEQ